MKKQDLATLAMIGISAGLLIGGCQQNQKHENGDSNGNGSASEKMTPDMQAFYASLSKDAQKKFMEMDAQHKMMAMEMAHQSCNGKNSCKGMGGCSTAKNSCAGKNDCKGQGGAPVKKMDEAVHVQHKHQMMQKESMNGLQQNGSMMRGNNSDKNSCGGPGGCGSMKNDPMDEGHMNDGHQRGRMMPKGRTHSY